MCNPAYLRLEYKPFFVAESSPLENYQAGGARSEWPDEEIAAIRVVLQKLTALRIMNASDAEDLVQDTLLTMIMKCPESELEKGPLVWSLGILRKKVGNYYRKAQRYSSLSQQEAYANQCIFQSPPATSPEMKVFREELRTIVDGLVAELPPSQREAMELLVAGLDAGEIATRLNTEHYQNVINRLYRGRMKLAKALVKYGYGPRAKTGIKRKNNGSARG
jgi:RNA polymerase sigma factor (sigma-70 family)